MAKIDIDRFKVYKPRRMSPKVEGYRVRINKTRITYSAVMHEEIGNPDRVDILYDPEASVFAIREQSDPEMGYKVQDKSKTTRSIAAKAPINHLDMPFGTFDAEIRNGLIVWAIRDEE